jgi:AcrR family transcriptional regulator
MRVNNDAHATGAAEAPRRSRGRPQVRPDEETRALIIEAAAQEFQANGYAATCIADVAERAGVSTKTLYRLIPTKADLFASVVTERISRFVFEVDHNVDNLCDPAAALERMLIAYGTLTLEVRTIAIIRLVYGECGAFPEIAAAFYQKAIQRTGGAMEALLQRLCARGLIALDDPLEATGMLRGMMIMEPQRAAMLGQLPAPDADAIAARAKRCVRLFLEGCSQQGRADARNDGAERSTSPHSVLARGGTITQ